VLDQLVDTAVPDPMMSAEALKEDGAHHLELPVGHSGEKAHRYFPLPVYRAIDNSFRTKTRLRQIFDFTAPVDWQPIVEAYPRRSRR
jgi:hypothetical protein